VSCCGLRARIDLAMTSFYVGAMWAKYGHPLIGATWRPCPCGCGVFLRHMGISRWYQCVARSRWLQVRVAPGSPQVAHQAGCHIVHHVIPHWVPYRDNIDTSTGELATPDHQTTLESIKYLLLLFYSLFLRTKLIYNSHSPASMSPSASSANSVWSSESTSTSPL
jgi:hypothetical protein